MVLHGFVARASPKHAPLCSNPDLVILIYHIRFVSESKMTIKPILNTAFYIYFILQEIIEFSLEFSAVC